MFISDKNLKKLCQDYYSKGVTKGYELGYGLGKTERDNRGFVMAGTKVDQELKEILKSKEENNGRS